jgi:hypothetical protein
MNYLKSSQIHPDRTGLYVTSACAYLIFNPLSHPIDMNLSGSRTKQSATISGPVIIRAQKDNPQMKSLDMIEKVMGISRRSLTHPPVFHIICLLYQNKHIREIRWLNS